MALLDTNKIGIYLYLCTLYIYLFNMNFQRNIKRQHAHALVEWYALEKETFEHFFALKILLYSAAKSIGFGMILMQNLLV